jgi:hypothetical protein
MSAICHIIDPPFWRPCSLWQYLQSALGQLCARP